MTDQTNQEELDFDDVAAEEAELIEEFDDIPTETPNERFLRLVNKRLPVAVKRIRLIGNLASNNYDMTESQAEAVIEVLQKTVEDVAQEFNRRLNGSGVDDVPTIE